MTSPVEHTPLDKTREIFEINLFGQVAVIQTFPPLVRRAKGRIIKMGAVGDHITPPLADALLVRKQHSFSMTAALRLELRAQGIHVCLAEADAIITPIHATSSSRISFFENNGVYTASRSVNDLCLALCA